MSNMRSLTQGSSAMPSPKRLVFAPFVKSLGELAPLLDTQDVAGISKRLADAAGQGIDVGHLLGPELLDGGAVDGGGGEELADPLAGRFCLFRTRRGDITH